jgi:hypothetical protein
MTSKHVDFQDLKKLNRGQKAFLKCILVVMGVSMEDIAKSLKIKYKRGSRGLVSAVLSYDGEKYSKRVVTEILSIVDPTLKILDFFLMITNDWFNNCIRNVNFHKTILPQVQEKSNIVNQKFKNPLPGHAMYERDGAGMGQTENLSTEGDG